MNTSRALRIVLIAALTGPLMSAAWSQAQRSGGGVSAQLYQQYQQAVAEKTELQTANLKLKADLDDATKQLAALKHQLADAKSAAGGAQSSLAAAQSARDLNARNLATLRAQTEDLIQHFRETAANLQSVETDRATVRQELAHTKAAFDQCAVNNYELFKVNSEVLDRYAHQGAFSYVARAEPFTRIERNRIDNLVLEYRERAEALRMQKQATRTPSADAATGQDHTKRP